jgi:hypothetical protein
MISIARFARLVLMSDPDDEGRSGTPEQRYYPSADEIEILRPALIAFYELEKRSELRRTLIDDTRKLLSRWPYWTDSRLRVWFRNNRTKYVSTPAKRDSLSPRQVFPNYPIKPIPLIPPGTATNPPRILPMPAVVEATGFAILDQKITDMWNDLRSIITNPPGPLHIYGTADPVKERARLLEGMVELVTGANLSISTLNGPSFQSFLRDTMRVQPALLPSGAELREEIVKRAERLRNGIRPDTEGGQYVTLMVYGAASAHRTWLGACIATHRRFYVWRLTALTDQTADSIQACLRDIATDLRKRGFIVVAVVTDNARNEIKAVEDLSSKSFPGLPYAPFVFRIPCLSHTLNLVLVDFAKTAFGKHNIYTDITYIRESLPLKARFKIPTPCATRWTSLNKFVRYLLMNYSQIVALINTHKQRSRITEAMVRLGRYRWNELEPCLAIIDDFVNWASSQSKFMTGAWSRAIAAATQLQHLGDSGNHYGGIFADKLMTRMRETADMSLLILSHLMSRTGVKWYCGLPDDGGDGDLSSKESVDRLVRPLLEQFREFLGADATVWYDTWNEHRSGRGVADGTTTSEYWRTREVDAIAREHGAPFRPWSHLATMARILGHLPCSEAAVERLFSLMRLIFGTRSQSMLEDLIEARLFLMLHGRFTFLDAQSLGSVWEAHLPRIELTVEEQLGLEPVGTRPQSHRELAGPLLETGPRADMI